MVLGGPEETGRLLEHKFDYIFFTGEGRPGRCPGGAGTSESRVRKQWGRRLWLQVGSTPEGSQPGLWASEGRNLGWQVWGQIRRCLGRPAKVS